MVGPSGAGKNTVISRVIATLRHLGRLPTATTREPREGEEEGVDHYFVSLAVFNEMIANNALIEHEEVHPGKWYGVIRQFTHDKLAAGAFLLADIDIKGATALRREFPNNVVSIFIAPPTLEVLRARLKERGETSEEIEKRLQRAAYEISRKDECDYVVINDDLEACVREVANIISCELAKRATPEPGS
jgi:guanylate kinase